MHPSINGKRKRENVPKKTSKRRTRSLLQADKGGLKDSDIRMSCVKMKLRGILKPAYAHMKGEIETVCRIMNRWIHEADIVANAVMAFATTSTCRFEIPKPDQKFFDNIMGLLAGGTSKIAILNHFFETEWSGSGYDFPIQCKGLSYMRQTAAREMATRAATHLWYHFEARQKRAVNLHVNNMKIAASIVKCINDPSKNLDEHKEYKAIIAQHRAWLRLDVDAKVTERWLKANSTHVLRYYGHLIRTQEAELYERGFWTEQKRQRMAKERKLPKIRTFSFLPISGYGLNHILISNRDLFCVLRRLRMFPSSKFTQDFVPRYKEVWEKIFDIPKRNNWNFNYSLQTNGVEVSIHFWKPKAFDFKNRKVNLGFVKKGLYTADQVKPMDFSGYFLSASDPGCQPLAVFSSGEKWHKKTWYEKTGLNVNAAKRHRHKESLSVENKLRLGKIAEHSLKTSDFKTFMLKWQARKVHEDFLFRFYSHTQYANQHFYHFQRKQAFTEELIRKLIGRRKRVIIGWGNGKFRVSMKSQKTGPGISLARKLAQRVPVVLLDEFRTSKICRRCGGGMKNEKLQRSYIDKETREIKSEFSTTHEILRCSNNVCRVWRDRNRNAAENLHQILRCVLAGKARPLRLQRGS